MVGNPVSNVDLDILCGVSEIPAKPNLIDVTGGVCYRVIDYNTITQGKTLRGQKDLQLKELASTFDHITKTRFKFIEFPSELLRRRYSEYIKKMLKLEKIPHYLVEYLNELKTVDKTELERIHIKFWRNLFQKVTDSQDRERSKIGNFIHWQNRLQEERGSDLFIPGTPYINAKNSDFLVGKSIEMN